jgi:hypothetical protein
MSWSTSDAATGGSRSRPPVCTAPAASASTSTRSASRKPTPTPARPASRRSSPSASTDVSQATVVTTYLLTASNLKLRPMLTRTLKPGARIVAHNFGFGDWTPETVDTFTDSSGHRRTLYLWITDGIVRP